MRKGLVSFSKIIAALTISCLLSSQTYAGLHSEIIFKPFVPWQQRWSIAFSEPGVDKVRGEMSWDDAFDLRDVEFLMANDVTGGRYGKLEEDVSYSDQVILVPGGKALKTFSSSDKNMFWEALRDSNSEIYIWALNYLKQYNNNDVEDYAALLLTNDEIYEAALKLAPVNLNKYYGRGSTPFREFELQLGVFAKEKIEPGQFVVEYTGRINKYVDHISIPGPSSQKYDAEYYGFSLDAEFGGSPARFINDTLRKEDTNLKWRTGLRLIADPNSQTWYIVHVIVFVSTKEIEANTQLFISYGDYYWGTDGNQLLDLANIVPDL